MALGHVLAWLDSNVTPLEVEIDGEMCAALVLAEALYDPSRERRCG